jgi:hypothetical protein
MGSVKGGWDLHLFRLGSSEDTSGDVLVLLQERENRQDPFALPCLSNPPTRTRMTTHLDTPSQSQMSHRTIQLLLRNLGEFPDLLNLRLGFGGFELLHRILEEIGVGRVSGIFGDFARVVFPGQLQGGGGVFGWVSDGSSCGCGCDWGGLTNPLAKGDQMVVPNPCSPSNKGLYSTSNFSRCNIEY